MNEAEARRLLRRHGWTAFVRVKSSGQYLLARKRIDGKLLSVYLIALTRLAWYSTEDIKRKLPDVA